MFSLHDEFAYLYDLQQNDQKIALGESVANVFGALYSLHLIFGAFALYTDIY